MWGIGINWDHVALWRGWLVHWLIFVGCILVLGWHLGPRSDEVAFVLALPLWILVPYALLCLLLAAVRVLWLGAVAFTRRLIRNSVVIRQHLLGFRPR